MAQTITQIIENETVTYPENSLIIPLTCSSAQNTIFSLVVWNEDVLLTGGSDKKIQVWKTKYQSNNKSLDCIGIVNDAHENNVRNMAVKEDMIVSVSWDKGAKIWKWNHNFWKQHNIGYYQNRKIPNDKVTISENSVTEAPLECIKTWIVSADWVVCCCFWNGNLVTGDFHGNIVLWETQDDNKNGTKIKNLSKHSGYATSVVSVGSKLWSTASDGFIHVHSIDQTQPHTKLTVSSKGALNSLLQENELVYVGASSGKVYVLSTDKKEELHKFGTQKRTTYSMVIWNDLLITASEDHSVAVWTRNNKGEYHWKHHSSVTFAKPVKKVVVWQNQLWFAVDNALFGFRVRRLEWAKQRLIWLAYLKNADQKECYLGRMPKDLIRFLIRTCNE